MKPAVSMWSTLVEKLTFSRSATWSRSVLVSVVVFTIMRHGVRHHREVIRARVTTVLLFGIVLLVIYTVLLHSRGNSKSNSGYSEGNHQRLYAKYRPHATNISDSYNSMAKIMWNVADYDSMKHAPPKCRREARFIILVTSAPHHFTRRTAIRQSWCNPRKLDLPEDSWQCVFLIGSLSDSQIDGDVQAEQAIHGDILRGTYQDSYRNLTFKVIHGFHWFANSCHQSHVLKTDDDCFINVKLLYKLIGQYKEMETGLYVGNVFFEKEKRLVTREKTSRWYVSVDEYPKSHYPPYTSGVGYLISRDLIPQILLHSHYLRPFPVEDAYIGVIVHLLGVKPVASSRFRLSSSGWTLCNYLFLLVIHGITPDEQNEMLHKTMLAPLDCPRETPINTWNDT